MSDYPFDQSVIWHVVFHKAPASWGTYRHVSLAGYGDTTWVHLDLQRRGVHAATIFRHDEVKEYLSFLTTYYTVLRFGPARPCRGFILRPMTCVSFVKHTLGFRSGALRPDTLLRDLLRDPDVQVVNETECPQGNASPSGAATPGET